MSYTRLKPSRLEQTAVVGLRAGVAGDWSYFHSLVGYIVGIRHVCALIAHPLCLLSIWRTKAPTSLRRLRKGNTYKGKVWLKRQP
eukprot:4224779-Amphidinium_carterae.1